MPEFLGIGIAGRGDRRQLPEKLGKEQRGDDHDGKDHDFRLDDTAQAGAGQLDLPEIHRGLAVVVDGDRGVPDLDALIAEKFGSGDKARLPNQRQADELSGDSLHAGGDVRHDAACR